MQLKVLTDQDIQKIHEATLKVLETTGVSFKNSPQSIQIARECGCRIENERIRFPRKTVAKYLKLVPDRTSFRFFMPQLGIAGELDLSEGVSHFGVIGNAYYIYDFAARRYRDVIEQDLPEKLLVYDNLSNLQLDCCNFLYHSERRGISTKTSAYIDVEGSPDAMLYNWVSLHSTYL